MELKALWQMFLRRWYLIAIPLGIALALTAPDLLAMVQGGENTGGGWTTVIHLTAAQPPTGEELGYEDAGYFPWLASEYVVNGLTDWVRTSSFATEVSNGLAERNIEIEAGVIRGVIAADNARSVMQLFLTWPDHDQLQAMAEVAVNVLQNRNAVYFPQFAVEPAQVIALDEIILTPVAPPLTNRFGPLVQIALGLVAGIALAVIVEYLDDTVYSRDDLETLSLPILGEIPRHRKE